MPSVKVCQDSAVDTLIATPREAASTVWTWLALLSLVTGWLSIAPIYSPPHWSAVFFFLFAIASFMVAFRQTEIAPLPREYLGLLVPLGVSIMFVPWPYNAGAVLLSFSIVMAARERSLRIRRAGLSLGACSLVLLLESAVQPILFQVFAHYHGLPWAAKALQLILRSIGVGASVGESVLHQQTHEALVPVNITSEALGLYIVASIAIVGIASLLVLKPSRKRWLAFFAVLAVYPAVRYPLLLLTYEEFHQIKIFWSPWFALLTFAPLPVLLTRLVTPHVRFPERMSWPQLSFRRGTNRVLLASFAATICIIGMFSFQDPGIGKQGRILIDEAHSNWEWTTRKYDTKWYNEASGYNYYCLADYLSRFYRVDRGRREITPELLRGYDVLILKTLTSPLRQEEIDAIVDFVHAGGGLWLVGDHTNVFGISTRMNRLAQRFGMSYNYDSTYDLITGNLSLYCPSTLLPHPTVQHMPPVFLFGTSCSMNASLWADYPVIGYGLLSRRADYSRENFFPEHKVTLDQKFGLLPQEVAVGFGRGRVVAWTDSTVFSNFWFYMPGKSELCLGTTAWLNKCNRWGSVRWILGFLAVCAAWLTIRWLRGTNPVARTAIVLAGALLGVPIGTQVFAGLNRAAYPLPAPRRQLPRVAFEREHCNFTLTDKSLLSSRYMGNHYQTFFVWTQRLGYIPQSTPSLDAALTEARVLVLVNPNKGFSGRERWRIKQFLQAGGKVLVLDGAQNANSTANLLLEDYGISINRASLRQSWVFDRKGRKIAAVGLPRPVSGGESLLTMALGRSFAAAAKVGRGLVVAVGSSHIFADRSMGTTSTVPNVVQSGFYEMEFWLLRNLMQGSSDPTLWDSPQPMQQPPNVHTRKRL